MTLFAQHFQLCVTIYFNTANDQNSKLEINILTKKKRLANPEFLFDLSLIPSRLSKLFNQLQEHITILILGLRHIQITMRVIKSF